MLDKKSSVIAGVSGKNSGLLGNPRKASGGKGAKGGKSMKQQSMLRKGSLTGEMKKSSNDGDLFTAKSPNKKRGYNMPF
jgi:hypothetical protein